MEPNQYWLLYFGLLFIFLGSKVGQAFRWWIYNIFRACFYAALALAAFAAAKLLLAVSNLLLKFTNANMQEQEKHVYAGSGAETANASRDSD
jgi:hypothetical protein